MFVYFASIGYSGHPYQIDHMHMMKIRLYVDHLWVKYDVDQDGYLQFEETREMFEEFARNRRDLGLKPSQHKVWFQALDQDGDNKISRFEMYEYFTHLNYDGTRPISQKAPPKLNMNALQTYVD